MAIVCRCENAQLGPLRSVVCFWHSSSFFQGFFAVFVFVLAKRSFASVYSFIVRIAKTCVEKNWSEKCFQSNLAMFEKKICKLIY